MTDHRELTKNNNSMGDRREMWFLPAMVRNNTIDLIHEDLTESMDEYYVYTGKFDRISSVI